MGNQPVKKFKAGGVTATVWNNQSDKGEYKTVNIERNYKDKEDDWKSTSSMRLNDLPKVALTATKAYEFLVLSGEKDTSSTNNDND